MQSLSTALDAATHADLPIGMAVLDGDDRVVQADASFGVLVGCEPVGRRLSALLVPGDGPGDVSVRPEDGCVTRARVARTTLRGSATTFLTLVPLADPGRRRTVEELLLHRAASDDLTGLASRTAFVTALDRAVAEADGCVAVLLLDLDGFKLVNDSHGHAAGDRLLVTVAERLRRGMRPDDVAGRFGGDEFLVLLRAVRDRATVERLVARLRALIEQPVEVAGTPVHVRASIGATLGCHGDSADRLLARADAAMYEAKRSGGRRAVVAGPEGPARARARLTLEDELREALADGAIEAHLQPTVRMATDDVVAAEALARWRRPDGTSVPPDLFVPVAEELGLSEELDLLVTGRAAASAAALVRQGVVPPSFQLGVNVDPTSLLDPSFPERLVATVAPTGFDPRRLVVELTERQVPADEVALAAGLAALREAGPLAVLDDFGVGQSSLARLVELPIDAVKLDRRFVTNLATPRGRAVVAGLLAMVRPMDVSAVVEGVETEAERDTLVTLGAELAQGWLWCPALPPDELVGWLAARRPLVPTLP